MTAAGATIGGETGERGPFLHRALLYGDPDALVAGAAPALVEGLEAGGTALAVLPPASAATLREALGAQARDVVFEDACEWYGRLGRTFERLARFIEGHASGGAPVSVVAENPRVAARSRESGRYEAMTNIAFARFRAELLCLYDLARTDERILADVRSTHPEVLEADGAGRSRDFVEPLAFMTRSDREGAAAAPPGAAAMRLHGSGELGALRRFVRARAAGWGLRGRALDDLVLAASEIASNVLVHTSGPGDVRVWVAGSEVVCEISDRGPGLADPFAGYRLPGAEMGSGRGLWMARQLCDEVGVRSGPEGTVVRLHQTLREGAGEG